MRFILTVAAMFATSAVAAEKLPLADTFGNDSGCQMIKGNYDDDGGIYLTADEYGGHEWSCSFKWISEGDDFGGEYKDANGKTRTLFAWSVITLCSGEGDASADLLAIQDMGDSVAIATQTDQEGPTILKPCP